MPAHRSYAPPVNGMLGRVFAQMGHEVTILTTALPAQTPEAAGDAGGQVHFLQGTTPGKMDARFWHRSAQVFDELHSKRPFDLVLGRGAATWGFHSQSCFAALVPVISNAGTYPRWLHRLERHLPNYTPALAKPLAVLHGLWDQIYRKVCSARPAWCATRQP